MHHASCTLLLRPRQLQTHRLRSLSACFAWPALAAQASTMMHHANLLTVPLDLAPCLALTFPLARCDRW